MTLVHRPRFFDNPILRSIIGVTLLFATSEIRSSFAQNCTLSPEEEANLLALSYPEFDQSPGNGWRIYAERGCFALVATLLDRYSALHKSTLEDWQNRTLLWHAGQTYAFDNQTSLAKERFRSSYNPAEPADTPLLWNDYVSATLAFLNKDAEKLRLHRDRIAQGPVWNGERANLSVVNRLLKCIGQSYKTAYTDPLCEP